DVATFLLLAAKAHQRRADPVHVHILRAARFACSPHLLAEDEVLPGRPLSPAPLGRPMRHEQPRLRKLRTEFQAELGLLTRTRAMAGRLAPVGRELTLQEILNACAVVPLLLRPIEIHILPICPLYGTSLLFPFA